MSTLPRPEYPRPQMQRQNWQNLNGSWDFAFDYSDSGKDRQWFKNKQVLQHQITVPFCPESRLSGIGETDFMAAVWYRKTIVLERAQLEGRILLHFGAVDYHCEVWVNEQPVGSHDGGYSSFSFDITDQAQEGENTLTVYARDDVRSGRQPAGKQSPRYFSYACSYTRTTGIWQTVWLEFVPRTWISNLKINAAWRSRALHLRVNISGDLPDSEKSTIRATLRVPESKEAVAGMSCAALIGENRISFQIGKDSELKPWAPGNPYLYDLTLDLVQGDKIIDTVESYCGFRDLELRSGGLYINGSPVYQRLILDQGYYPEGIYTAPDDADLKKDIELSLDLGFNGARLHQKVFEPRFLYWADKLGYLVWGEQASWVLDLTSSEGLVNFLPEWLEVMDRDYNHPSLIGWCPLNETWDQNGSRQCDAVVEQIYLVTKAIDPTRPVIDTSGNYHVRTDIFDIHDYEQNVENFAAKFKPMAEGGEVYNTYPDRQLYGGQPYFVSEYGGTWWNPQRSDGWGYGENPASEEEFAGRYRGLTEILLQNKRICAFCYTQLTDVEQEQNGLYTYDRQPKFSAKIYERIRQTNLAQAAFEQEGR